LGNFRANHLNVPRTIKTFSNIEINDAAMAALRKFSPTIPDDRATARSRMTARQSASARKLRQWRSRVDSGTTTPHHGRPNEKFTDDNEQKHQPEERQVAGQRFWINERAE
jgi:hypothetical protein